MNKKLSESKEIQAFSTRKTDVISIAESVVVKKTEDIKTAIDHIAVADALLKEVKKKREKIVPKLHQAHRAATAMFAELTDPLNAAISVIKKKVSDFRLAERTRIDEANRKRIAESDAKEAAKQKRLNDRAKKLDDLGRTEEAEAKRDEADAYVAPAPEIEAFEKTDKTSGGSLTTIFEKKGKVVDGMAVVKAIADGTFPITMVSFDNKGVQAWIDQYKPKAGTIVNGIGIIEVPKDTFRGG